MRSQRCHLSLRVSLDRRGTFGQTSWHEQRYGKAKEQKVQRAASQPIRKPVTGNRCCFKGVSWRLHPKASFVSFCHFSPHKLSSSSTVMTITPSPPGLPARPLTALQVVRPASETESLRRKQISNLHKYLSQRGMSPCLKYYK